MVSGSLVGRQEELARIAQLLRHAPESGGALLLRGDAGIGKSALLECAIEMGMARKMPVLRAWGVESEARLAFAGLHQLLRPVLSGLDALPPPQRAALNSAFGQASGDPPDRFYIALAALELLADAGAGEPVLVVVEDVHWLDDPSADVLAFIARRIESEPIVLLCSMREGLQSSLENGMPWMEVPGLDGQSAEALLDSRFPDLARPVRQRILDQAAGNPLALTELPESVARDNAAGELLPSWLPLTTHLEQAFAGRVTGLPAATRSALLVASLSEGAGIADVLRATALLEGGEIGLGVLDPAIAARLIEVTDVEVRFRHPLIRSAVYQRESLARRHAGHRALAEVLVHMPEQRAWHIAAATVGTDEKVAATLEAAALRSAERGAILAAVTGLERAARVTPEQPARIDRLLKAAELAVELGNVRILQRLESEARTTALSHEQRLRLELVRELAPGQTVGDFDRLRVLIDHAQAERDRGNPAIAMRFLWFAASRSYWAGPNEELRQAIVDTALTVGFPDDDTTLIAVLGFTMPMKLGGVVAERLARAPGRHGGTFERRALLTTGAAIGAADVVTTLSRQVIEMLRNEGRLPFLGRALISQSWGLIWSHDLTAARQSAEEGLRLAREADEVLWVTGGQAALGVVHALSGQRDVAMALAAEADDVVTRLGARSQMANVALARCIAELGQGQFDAAYEQFLHFVDPSGHSFHEVKRAQYFAYYVDAAVHSGHIAEARALLADVERDALQTTVSTVRLNLDYARAMLAPDHEAEQHFESALSHDLGGKPYFRAANELGLGSWLRRHRRVAESRRHLRNARDGFDAIGLSAWADRARQELRATGEASPKRPESALDALTAQELQIARLAADGLTNREIGQRLFLSHRTVGSHLYRVFPKLGIVARNQLRDALD